ncbi:uncharacterized protein MICPUCDRAFT_66101 [Micromonas pusilla CCMP1545]|uniref:Predicted protein n=1 Tax=Micromonas pusilla (strain CCMP1545) TaxID=564608 RepID=C1NAJ6_MICPC|nr:uncharacterized protein MICPUCDRAFT_66101 [Micromonas pusilla CCMP1545]EEH50951.1 predicted protein [Micromonas pusilla CCMP1545]|eukprot:XP_003064971.1 predicted protein [Micromonas pusilla CCMP1545]
MRSLWSANSMLSCRPRSWILDVPEFLGLQKSPNLKWFMTAAIVALPVILFQTTYYVGWQSDLDQLFRGGGRGSPRNHEPGYVRHLKSGVGSWEGDAWVPGFPGPWVPIDLLLYSSYPLFILFLGDSLTHAMYTTACERLHLSGFELLSGFEACGGVGIGQDEYLLVYSLVCGSQKDPPYFRSCRQDDSGGNSKFTWDYTISRHLQEVTTSLVEKCEREPDIISIHFGVWDLANEWSKQTNYGADNVSWFDEQFNIRWQANVQRNLDYLSRAFPETMLFYRTNGPIIAEKLKDGVLESRLQPEYAHKLSVASSSFDSVAHVVDFHTLMKNNPEACTDGLHYTGISMFQSYFAIMINIFASRATSANPMKKRSGRRKDRLLKPDLAGLPYEVPCVVFLHIPKTAGTEFRANLLTFEKALAQRKGIQNYTTFQSLDNYGMIESLPPPRGVISGHWTGKLLRMDEFRKCTFVTVLRHPVERIRSTFVYHGHSQSHWRCLRSHIYQECRAPGNAPWNWFWMDNDIVRQLAGVRHWNRMDIFNYLRASDTLLEREDFQKNGSTIWRLYTELAIQTLQQVNYVCFSDNLIGCLEKLKDDFGVTEWNISVSHRNTGNPRNYDRGLDERIALANPYDMLIWNYAQKHCSSYKCRYSITDSRF